MPSAAEVKALYRALLKEGRKFPNYNIREYVKRKTKEDFRAHKAEADASVVEQLWTKAKSEYEIAKRQAVVYGMYARCQRSIMDVPLQAVLQEQASSGPYGGK
ncbi:hypothetical protein WJX72_000887 [[Myrmecia] bisecta]|uniref:Complex 1 LYR protein domain-containing protein n=1 Tax=[Myrmecia] bisecta TaxID=41462 RepID=A0AAW1QNU8_9CHLO